MQASLLRPVLPLKSQPFHRGAEDLRSLRPYEPHQPVSAVATDEMSTADAVAGRLAELMSHHDVGVATAKTIAIKRLNLDFFSPE